MGYSPQVVFRVGKLRSLSDVSAAAAHNARLRKTPNAIPGVKVVEYIDRNEISVVDRVRQIHAEISAHCKKNKWYERPDSVAAAEVVMSASPEYFRPDDPTKYNEFDQARLDAWLDVQVPWFLKEMEKENSIVVSLALHLDEATPHLQAIVVPRNHRGELSFRRVFGGDNKGEKLSDWQTRAAEPVAVLGIERGLMGSRAVHRKIKDYYGSVNAPTPELPPVKTKKPKALPPPTTAEKIPFTEAKASRDALEAEHDEQHAQWSAETKALRNAKLDAYPIVVEQAKAAKATERAQRQVERERDRALNKESNTREALAVAKVKADQMRALPLDRVLLDIYGAVESDDSKENYVSRKFTLPDGTEIAVTGDKWIEQGGGGGKGAINLVIHLDGLGQSGFSQAVRTLADQYGSTAAAAEVVASTAMTALAQVEALQAKPAALPEPEFRHWPRVKKWLEEVRGLPPLLIDWAKKAKLLYADQMANAVFPRTNGGAFLRGTGPTPFKRTVGGAVAGAYEIKGEEGADCFFCEAPIDALSIKAMRPDAHVIAAGGNLLSALALAQLVPSGTKRVFLAHDADDEGNRMAKALTVALDGKNIEVKRAKPTKNFKDWNEVLKAEPHRVDPTYGGPERAPVPQKKEMKAPVPEPTYSSPAP